jgi:hypothetical protein
MTRTDSGLRSRTPHHNRPARLAYYLGVAALLPVIGALLGPVALGLGIKGVRLRNSDPTAGGAGHALTGIILGTVTALVNWGVLVAIGIAAAKGHFRH